MKHIGKWGMALTAISLWSMGIAAQVVKNERLLSFEEAQVPTYITAAHS